jgi:hypothetical protein
MAASPAHVFAIRRAPGGIDAGHAIGGEESASYSNCRSSASRDGRSWPRAACLGVPPSNGGTFSSSQDFNGAGPAAGTELSARKVIAARANLTEAGVGAAVTILPGDALRTLAEVPGPIGLVLLGGWKDLCCACWNRARAGCDSRCG